MSQQQLDARIAKLQAEYDECEASIKSYAGDLARIIDHGWPVTVRLSRLSERKSRNEYNRFMTNTFGLATPFLTRNANLKEKQESLKCDIEKLRNIPVARWWGGSPPVITHQDIAHTTLADS